MAVPLQNFWPLRGPPQKKFLVTDRLWARTRILLKEQNLGRHPKASPRFRVLGRALLTVSLKNIEMLEKIILK